MFPTEFLHPKNSTLQKSWKNHQNSPFSLLLLTHFGIFPYQEWQLGVLPSSWTNPLESYSNSEKLSFHVPSGKPYQKTTKTKPYTFSCQSTIQYLPKTFLFTYQSNLVLYHLRNGILSVISCPWTFFFFPIGLVPYKNTKLLD